MTNRTLISKYTINVYTSCLDNGLGKLEAEMNDDSNNDKLRKVHNKTKGSNKIIISLKTTGVTTTQIITSNDQITTD